MGEKEGNPMYHNETAAQPSYLSLSIYYGGQEVYSLNSKTTRPNHTVSISTFFHTCYQGLNDCYNLMLFMLLSLVILLFYKQWGH